MRAYTEEHARSGLKYPLPAIECWENQYRDYKIEIIVPEYNAVCPKTGLPDFGTLYITYVPDGWCIELKSLKEYVTAYRNVGIFYENAVNRILRDLVAACAPRSMTIRGEFTPRGGIRSCVEASHTAATGRRTSRRRSRVSR